MLKPSHCLNLLLIALAGCADVGPGDASESREPDGSAAESRSQAAMLPIATITLSSTRRIEFHAAGQEIAISEFYPLGELPVLSPADKELSALALYQKYAPPNSEIPQVLTDASQPALDNEADPDRSIAAVANAVGGGYSAPSDAPDQARRVEQALNQGDGCNPPQSNVVFADCRTNWRGGYFAEGIPTWFFDDRVTAVRGSLDVKITSKYGGGTFVNTAHLNQGEVVNQHWVKARVCTEFLGFPISCSDVKAARRLDVINASSATFNVDVVFFN